MLYADSIIFERFQSNMIYFFYKKILLFQRDSFTIPIAWKEDEYLVFVKAREEIMSVDLKPISQSQE